MANDVCKTPPGAVPITQGAYTVEARAICTPPPPVPITYIITPCEPQIFIDCRKTLWFKDPYGDWMICRDGNDGWETTDLDTCPSALYPLLYDPDTNDFWYRDNGNTWIREDEGEAFGDWTIDWGNLPCILVPVFLNLTTGQPFYYPAMLSEVDLREVITDHPFCTTGYQS